MPELNKELYDKIKELEFQNREANNEIERLKNSEKFPCLNITSGSTPMTVAELVVRETPDIEWLKAIRYYIDCAINEPNFTED